MIQPSPLQLAQTAYRAYGEYTGGLTYNGRRMPAWRDLGPTVQGAWIAAAGAVEQDLHSTTVREEITVTLPSVPPMQTGTVPPTQTLHPWRATVRTVAAGIVALLPVLPSAVAAAGPQVLGWAGGLLAVTGAVTRVLAVPAVDRWLTEYVPFLGARPRQP